VTTRRSGFELGWESFGEDDGVLLETRSDGGSVGELEDVRTTLLEEGNHDLGVLPGESGETETEHASTDLVVETKLGKDGLETSVEGGSSPSRAGRESVRRSCSGRKNTERESQIEESKKKEKRWKETRRPKKDKTTSSRAKQNSRLFDGSSPFNPLLLSSSTS